MIPRIPHRWHGGLFPYEVFAGTEISPMSAHRQILDASLTLQLQNKLQIDQRPAFDELRTMQARLAIDFFLYDPQLCDPVAYAERFLSEPSAAVTPSSENER